MKASCYVAAVVMVVASSVSGDVLAVTPSGYLTESGLLIRPQLDSRLYVDDNILNQPTNEQSSAVFVLAPQVDFMLDRGTNQHKLTVGAESAHYFSSSDDDYLHHHLGLKSHFSTSETSKFDLLLQSKWLTEDRGTGMTARASIDNLIAEPLKYNQQLAGLNYRYGLASSQFSVGAVVNYGRKNYSNFKTLTQSRNTDSLLLGTTFYYTTHSRTDAFVEFKRNVIRYNLIEAGQASRDSNDLSALAGVKWQATALTSGTFKLGYQRKSFSDQSRENFSGLSWFGEIDWQPLSYSKVSFNTARQAKDPNVEGDYVKESSVGVHWVHHWSSLFSTQVSSDFIKQDYVGGQLNRRDDSTKFSVSASYAVRRWLDAKIYVESYDQDSTDSFIVYDKNTIGVSLVVTL